MNKITNSETVKILINFLFTDERYYEITTNKLFFLHLTSPWTNSSEIQ